VGDCNNFLTSNENWAERAAKLGWDAPALFGFRRKRPLDYALEFPDGQIVLLTFLKEGQEATVLQLPATGVRAKAPQQPAYT
jgi:hypothetical protein